MDSVSVWEKKVGKDGRFLGPQLSWVQDLVQLPATKKISPSPKVGCQPDPAVKPHGFPKTIRQIQSIAKQKPWRL